jgi:hypothetical protein
MYNNGKCVELVFHLFSSANIIAAIKLKRRRWAKHIAPMGEIIVSNRPEYGTMILK